MSCYSCDGQGITWFVDDAGKRTFDRGAAVKTAGWTLHPAIKGSFASIDETSGSAKTHEQCAAENASLSGPNRNALALRFGIGEAPMTRDEVATKLGVTSAQVKTWEEAMFSKFGHTDHKMWT